MLTPRLSKESARHLHRQSWDVRPHLHAHGWRRSDDGEEFVEVLTLLKLHAKVVKPYGALVSHSKRASMAYVDETKLY